MGLWWERWPERLEYEFQELQAAGIPYVPVDERIAAGVFELSLEPVVEEKPVKLIATFPDNYPFFRFEVRAPDISLGHHQHPFQKVLCLLGRRTDQWYPSDTLARIITARLTQTLSAGQSIEKSDVADVEELQAEPFSDYYPYRPAICIVDSSWTIPINERCGELTLGILGLSRFGDLSPFLHAVVLDVRGTNGKLLAAVDPWLRRRFASSTLFSGRWSRANSPIPTDDPKEAFRRAGDIDTQRDPAWASTDGYRLQVRGVVFPEEVAWRQSGDGWVFLVRSEKATGATGPHDRIPSRTRHKGRSSFRAACGPSSYYFARAGRMGRADLSERIPELTSLPDLKIAQFGVGCIGGSSALEFARAGIGELCILDDDIVDPSTTVRWPLGLPASGRLKVETLKSFIEEHYPYTKTSMHVFRLGGYHVEPPTESDVLDEMSKNAALIYDATAELGVQHFLSEYARDRGLPYIAVAAEKGGWGGSVVRIRPGVTEGCWGCLQASWTDGSIPFPPADPTGEVQPAGCANPTYTGAFFDLQLVALQGVRMAISTLCVGTAAGYPSMDWDVMIIFLRTSSGEAIAPLVRTFKLERHPQCTLCNARLGLPG
jgi:hypothetical protein